MSAAADITRTLVRFHGGENGCAISELCLVDDALLGPTYKPTQLGLLVDYSETSYETAQKLYETLKALERQTNRTRVKFVEDDGVEYDTARGYHPDWKVEQTIVASLSKTAHPICNLFVD